MKSLLLLLLLACAAPAASAATVQPTNPPLPVPELTFHHANGQPARLSDFRGRVVLLNLWATWCGPCVQELPALDRVQATLGGPDFQVLTLSVDRGGAAVVGPFLEKRGLGHLSPFIDPEGRAMDLFNLGGIPVTILIDREGRERGRIIGAAQWDSPQMMTLLRRLLVVEPPRVGAGGGAEPL